MEPIRTLVRGLRRNPVEWTFRQLPGGSANPLVRAGVLMPSSRTQSKVDCPRCDDCSADEMPRWYREPSGTGQGARLLFTCPVDGTVHEFPEEWIRIWEYDEDRLANLVADAMGCGDNRSKRDGIWRFGLTKEVFGKNRRELVVATRLDSEEDAAYAAINGNGSFLFAGLLTCDIRDDNVKRRVFQFTDVLGFGADGTLTVNRDVIASRFGVEASSKPRNRGQSERSIAESLFKYATGMLRCNGEDLRKAHKGMTVEWIAGDTGFSQGTVSKAIKVLQLKNAASNKSMKLNTAQIYYCICVYEQFFEAFREIAHGYKRTLQPKDVDAVAKKVMAHIGAKRGCESSG